jgi:uncharacterized protein YacL
MNNIISFNAKEILGKTIGLIISMIGVYLLSAAFIAAVKTNAFELIIFSLISTVFAMSYFYGRTSKNELIIISPSVGFLYGVLLAYIYILASPYAIEFLYYLK